MARTRQSPALARLYRLADTDMAAVIVDPIWRDLRAQDPTFLAKTPAAFRLALLRQRFLDHPSNPWEPVVRATGGEPEWPMWDGPIFDLRGDHEYEQYPDTIRSPRLPLAHGWSYALTAHRGDAYFALDDGPTEDGPYPLDLALELLFSRPDCNPRGFVNPTDISISPDNGYDFRYSGVEVFRPDGDEVEDSYDESLEGWRYDDSRDADTELIAQLRPSGSRYVRHSASGELPRPLFARAPEVDTSYAGEGVLTCTWRTTFFVPTEPDQPSDELWTYTRHELWRQTVLTGPSTSDLQADVWRYKTISDLSQSISAALRAPATHNFLMPIYDAVLFDQAHEIAEQNGGGASDSYPPAEWLLTRLLTSVEAFQFLARCFSERMSSIRMRCYAYTDISSGIYRLRDDYRISPEVAEAMSEAMHRLLPEGWDQSYQDVGALDQWHWVSNALEAPDLGRAIACLYLSECLR